MNFNNLIIISLFYLHLFALKSSYDLSTYCIVIYKIFIFNPNYL